MEAMRLLLLCIYCLPKTDSKSREDEPDSTVQNQALLVSIPGEEQLPAQSLPIPGPIKVNLHFRNRRQVEVAPPDIVEDVNEKYDPNRGYEPYWPGGEWVFKKRTTKGTTKRTTTLPKLCGTTCNHLLKKMGEVCGHRQNDVGILKPDCPNNKCNGRYLDDYYQFSTFDDYCDFMRAQCDSKVNEKWIFVHMGACDKDYNQVYKPIAEPWHVVSRAKWRISSVSNLMAKYSSRTISWG